MSYEKQIADAVLSAMYEAIRESGEWSVASDMPDIDLDAIIASIQKPEPFGYFRCDPALGWEDCSEDAEGAIALYEEPASDHTSQLTDGEIKAIADHEMMGILYWATDEKIYIDSDQREVTKEILSFARAIERKLKGGAA